MKKKLLLLFSGFVIFYVLLHAGKQLPGLLQGRTGWVADIGDAPKWLNIATDLLFGAGFIYTAYAILHYCYPKKKLALMIVSLLLSFIILILLSYGAASLQREHEIRLNNFFRSNILYFVLYTGFGCTWYLVQYAYYRELNVRTAMLAARQAELTFLRSQVNPHFLFNNLNNIYSLVHQKSDSALPAIAALSDMLRYMLYENEEAVPLENEIACIRQYMALEKLRLHNAEEIQVMVNGDTSGKTIAPLLLLPFVENAYKHGDFSQGGDWLKITFFITKNEFEFEITNRKTFRTHAVPGGLGLVQAAKRLQLVYPGKHILKISNNEDLFTLRLTISYA